MTRRPLRKLLSLLSAASLAIAMLSAAASECPEMPTVASVGSAAATDGAHDCGDQEPATPRPGHHECRMLAPCASVALATSMSIAIGERTPAARPIALNDARPSDVILALVAPPPRA
jgi:hypothetical protein